MNAYTALRLRLSLSFATRTRVWALAAGVGLAAGGAAFGQSPIISSFTHHGELVCTNLGAGSLATVEWASALTGPWTNNWAGQEAVRADSNGVLRVNVPMFYRVRWVAAPEQMALIPAGPFSMGAAVGDGMNAEAPVHVVNVSAFFMDQREVTKSLWDEVVGWATNHGHEFSSPGGAKAPNHPVHTVSWFDAVKWCNARSQREGLTPCYYTDAGFTTVYTNNQLAPHVNWSANGYRLPTEAEWEKAARGGATGRRFPWSDADTIMHSRANYRSSESYPYDTSPTRGYHPAYAVEGTPYTSPGGSFPANGYGLFDLAGNVMEWCWDWYDAAWYANPGATQTDTRGPVGPLAGRVVRDGSWFHFAGNVRCATRDGLSPASGMHVIGFRCVRRY